MLTVGHCMSMSRMKWPCYAFSAKYEFEAFSEQMQWRKRCDPRSDSS